tara:strand:+ start:277 stop:465 length:189 start_codon:yes stop_codon:yes gene_type:complete
MNGEDMEHDCNSYTKAIVTYIAVLKAEISHLKTQLEPHDTGHIHTTISTLQRRVEELEQANP